MKKPSLAIHFSGILALVPAVAMYAQTPAGKTISSRVPDKRTPNNAGAAVPSRSRRESRTS